MTHKVFFKNKEAAKKGGKSAGDARKSFEKSRGVKVVSDENFKQQIKEAKKQKKLTNKRNKDKK